MIYLVRARDSRIAAAESNDAAARLIARGFVRCSRAAYIAYWRRNDRNTLAMLAWEAGRRQAPVQARAVGEPGLPPGFVLPSRWRW
jgi:hypothetical protein